MKMPMSFAVRFVILGVTVLAGCRAAHNVAVTSFRVIDAPANYVRRQIDNEAGRTTTTTTYQSDVVTPGQQLPNTPPQRRAPSQPRSVAQTDAETNAPARDAESTARDSSSRPASTQSPKIPYAKPVPGKPGYVYSPFDPAGGYVDVTGYAAGSKAKDPYSGKIFIVP